VVANEKLSESTRSQIQTNEMTRILKHVFSLHAKVEATQKPTTNVTLFQTFNIHSVSERKRLWSRNANKCLYQQYDTRLRTPNCSLVERARQARNIAKMRVYGALGVCWCVEKVLRLF
jgi:hypothetical protein